jgi:hypothetical protein
LLCCALKQQYTTAERRFLKRHLDEDALTRMNARANFELLAKRRCAAEHPFGTIKRMMAGGRFLSRNLKGSRAEMALSVLAYNMLRRLKLQITGAYFRFHTALSRAGLKREERTQSPSR